MTQCLFFRFIPTTAVVALTLFSGACAWVKPAEDAHHVALVKPQAVMDCKKLGITTASTLNSIVGIQRKEAVKVNELVTLAKNEAAVMQGDTIVAKGPLDKGKQDFYVYRCHYE